MKIEEETRRLRKRTEYRLQGQIISLENQRSILLENPLFATILLLL